MADRELILCKHLCLISSKFRKLTLSVLTSAIINFYSINALVVAKICLLDDVILMGFSDQLPHILKRRGYAHRLVHKVDDVFALFQFVDEYGQLSKLPLFRAFDSSV